MLELTVLLAQRYALGAGRLALRVPHQPALARLQELLAPLVVEVGVNTFSATQLGNAVLSSKTFKDDADLLFGSELAAGVASDIPDELLCFFGPGLSLPELV